MSTRAGRTFCFFFAFRCWNDSLLIFHVRLFCLLLRTVSSWTSISWRVRLERWVPSVPLASIQFKKAAVTEERSGLWGNGQHRAWAHFSFCSVHLNKEKHLNLWSQCESAAKLPIFSNGQQGRLCLHKDIQSEYRSDPAAYGIKSLNLLLIYETRAVKQEEDGALGWAND